MKKSSFYSESNFGIEKRVEKQSRNSLNIVLTLYQQHSQRTAQRTGEKEDHGYPLCYNPFVWQ